MDNIKNIISKLTLEEKASLCSGQDFWRLKGIERVGIPSIMVTDGPHGLRKQVGEGDQVELTDSVPATCFPTASTLAATWDRDLIIQVGKALGEECLEEKVSVILGPGVNIKRSPLGGRNFEYFSEDPYLTGEIAKCFIDGVQSMGVGTSIKHYAVNNQETRRMVIDAVVDERALREIYLTGYEIAVKDAQPWTVMCAYNKVNGTYCAENEYLCTEILKDEWGHYGLVVTDWGAMNDRVAGLKAGVELEMPGSNNGNDALIVEAVESGILDEVVLDRAVERILTLIYKSQEALTHDVSYDRTDHHALARKAAGEGAVLLKNHDNVLPLLENAKIAVVGQFAKVPRYQGAGSSLMNPTQLDNLYDEIAKIIGEKNLVYADGYNLKSDQVDEALIAETLETVSNSDAVVISAGLREMDDIEGLDRKHLHLPASHNDLIEAIAAVHPKVIVVLSNGSAVEMPWVDKVAGILEGYLGGQAGAGGIADILFGKVNPSGKLAETFPVKLEDDPTHHYFPSGPATVEYRESLYVGYRYFDSVEQDVLFPFGHGLSYTTFEYEDLNLSPDQISDQDSLVVSIKIKNTGSLAGKEIVQVYVRDVDSAVFRPDKELKGFAKVNLQPGEEKVVEVVLNKRSFAYYNTDIKDWHVESGRFEILVGASSRDIRLNKFVEVTSSQKDLPRPDRQLLSAYYNFPKGSPIRKEDFEALYGGKLPLNETPKKGSFTLNTTFGDMRGSFIGRLLSSFIGKQMKKMIEGIEDTPTGYHLQAVGKELPIHSMLMSGDESITREMLEALLLLINGKWLAGIGSLIRAIRNK